MHGIDLSRCYPTALFFSRKGEKLKPDFKNLPPHTETVGNLIKLRRYINYIGRKKYCQAFFEIPKKYF
jgi:hypothetical protein